MRCSSKGDAVLYNGFVIAFVSATQLSYTKNYTDYYFESNSLMLRFDSSKGRQIEGLPFSCACAIFSWRLLSVKRVTSRAAASAMARSDQRRERKEGPNKRARKFH